MLRLRRWAVTYAVAFLVPLIVAVIPSFYSGPIQSMNLSLGFVLAVCISAVLIWRVFVDRMEWELKLRDAKEQAVKANHAKSLFLANMSHEIRTPLAAVIGFAELMLSEDQSPTERRESINAIIRNGKLLSRLIDDILDLSKIEAGRIQVEILEFSLPDLVANVSTLFNNRARNKGINFVVECAGTIPATIKSDPVKIHQILVNLIGNAIKFTHRGTVKVLIRYIPDEVDDKHCTLEFLVQDSGLGISPKQAKRLFKPFSQAEVSTGRRYGGTGLGLVLSQRLARALGGDVVLDNSMVGVGTTFKVTIKALACKGSAQVAFLSDPAPIKAFDSDVRLDGKKILLIEDGEDNQLLLSRLLQRSGATIDLANDGKVGVAKAQANDYDLVLMDIDMPVLNGYDATILLRKQGYKVPIIALTAFAMKEERQRCLRAGCNEHLTKPIDRALLIHMIATLTKPVKELETTQV